MEELAIGSVQNAVVLRMIQAVVLFSAEKWNCDRKSLINENRDEKNLIKTFLTLKKYDQSFLSSLEFLGMTHQLLNDSTIRVTMKHISN